MHQNYKECLDYFAENKGLYSEVSGFDLYKEVFPDNQSKSDEPGQGREPNAIYLYKPALEEGSKYDLHKNIMFADTWDKDYEQNIKDNPFTLCSGLAYLGKKNRLENAVKMYALIVDLDDVGKDELYMLLKRCSYTVESFASLPMPTFVALSGSGLHLYYAFEEPVILYPNILLQMKRLKYALTDLLWHYGSTTKNKYKQHQSINQGFRMVGSLHAKHETIIRAFRTGNNVTLDYLNCFVSDENKVDVSRPFRPSKISRTEAVALYPDWYEKVVVKGNRHPAKWKNGIKNGRAVYNWWLRQMEHVVGGHRYYFMMCMAIYASKCDVPKHVLRRDMKQALERMQLHIEHKNDLTINDMKAALEIYDKDFYNFTLDDIEKISGIRIERNKRNGRTQEQHLQIARFTRDLIHEDWRKGNGRPSAQAVVKKYRLENPEAKKADCIRDTKLSKPTVYKWWALAKPPKPFPRSVSIDTGLTQEQYDSLSQKDKGMAWFLGLKPKNEYTV